jgi:hypothetical protein
MEIQEFISKRPYLYHLTSIQNAEKIIEERKIYSANRLIDMSGNPAYQSIKRQKRVDAQKIIVNSIPYFLRDQQPISELALSKCLTNNWEVADFLEYLNARVFMWPTIDRLWRHFNRYIDEKPVIFRFTTNEVLDLNPNVKFCRLNSGATRANSYLGGKAPERGIDTFVTADSYQRPIGSVAEVTFENECDVNCAIHTSSKPDGVYKHV